MMDHHRFRRTPVLYFALAAVLAVSALGPGRATAQSIISETIDAAAAGRGAAPLCCGDTGITQNNNVADTGEVIVSCSQSGVAISEETAWARCFSGADFPTDFALKCVEFGVARSGHVGGTPLPDFDIDLRISALSAGCPPAGITFGDPAAGQTWHDAPAAFNVLHVQTVTIPDGSSGRLQFILEPPVVLPAGADILFELHAPSRFASDGGDDGVFSLGGNSSGAVGETYVWASTCGVTSYTALPDIDATFTDQWVLRLNGMVGPIVPPAVDCNTNGVPDECETDCNANGIPDDCDVDPLDPDGNGQVSLDCNANGVPDECELDCNANSIPDDCDIDPLDPDGNGLVSPDCNANGVPDECEPDCNASGSPDDCDIDPLDPDGNGLVSPDCNANGVPDECDVDIADPDGDGLVSPDCNANGIPDECGPDCNANGVPDDCDIDPLDPDGDGLVSADCQPDAIPDECQTELFTYSFDDSFSDFSFGLPSGGTTAWMNRFTVSVGFETISSIRLTWGPMANGTPTTVYLWSDPNADGDPTDAQVLASATTTVQNAGTNSFTDVAIPETYLGTAGTNFFAGAITTHQAGEKPISLDTSTQLGITWIVADTAIPIDPNNLGAAEIPPFLSLVQGTALVRAVAPGDDCNNNSVPDNCEGSEDVALFIAEVIAVVPDPFLACIFDVNVDGTVDGMDIQLFVDRLLSGP